MTTDADISGEIVTNSNIANFEISMLDTPLQTLKYVTR